MDNAEVKESTEESGKNDLAVAAAEAEREPLFSACCFPLALGRGIWWRPGGYSDIGRARTCSLMVLIPSGPRRDTACFTRSVRPQFSIRKPRSCLNLASMATASSFREAQKQSSALRKEEMVSWVLWLHQGLFLGEHRVRKHQGDFSFAVHVNRSFLGSSSWIRAW